MSEKPRSKSQGKPAWHAGFLKMLPAIRLHARISFRQLDPEAKAECIQQTVCNAMDAYRRLFLAGKLDRAHASSLARFAVSQTREGRLTGGHLNVRDVSSGYCQKRKHLTMQRLDKYDHKDDEWLEVLVEDRHAGPAAIVQTKLDFAAYLRSLPLRLRRIAKFLANGETTTATAEKFKLSAGRISQMRRELKALWHVFVNDDPEAGSLVAA